MGIFGALTTAVTGMRAQSYALENISGNIANSQTVAFKRQDTSFVDLIPDNIPSKQLAGNVIANSSSTVAVQGDIQNSSVGTYMAINGQGFFVVAKPSTFTDNTPVFDGTDLYTRRGDFAPDKNGYLVNGAGYYLMGIPIDATTGNLVGSVPQLLQFDSGFLPAQATTQIEYQANLASYPLTPGHDTGIPGSELLDPLSGWNQDPTVAGTGQVIGDDLNTFIQQSISGGAITAYDSSGAPVNVQLRWAKTDSSLYGGTDTWNLFYQSNSSATGTETAWTNAGINYKFGADNQMNPPITTLALNNVVIDGVSLGNIEVAHGAGGITQFDSAQGNAQVNLIQQNGFAAGSLETVTVNDKGRIVGSDSNGRTIDLAEITLASFSGADFLKRADGGAFEVTDLSGTPTYGASGKISGNSLEGSNVDIADEFTKLIVTQQAYSANTRVISTANDMTQDLLNMLR